MKDSIIKELSNKGIDIGACTKGIAELEHSSSDCAALAELYFKHAHFCLNSGFPTAGWIIDRFGDKPADFGIFCRNNGNVSNMRRVALLESAHVTAKYDEFSAAKIYLKGESQLDIEVSNNAFVFIDAFDNSVVNISASGNARVVVFQYGNADITESSCDNARVKITVKSTNSY